MSDADWTMPDGLFEWIGSRLGPADVVIEFGSGDGTKVLSELCGHVVSFEHNPKYLLPSTPKVKVVYAPLRDGWYDVTAVSTALPTDYRCVVIDGPPAREASRRGILRYIDLFDAVPFVVDDVQREDECRLAFEIADAFGVDLSIHYLRSGRAFATIGWGAFA